MLPAAAHDLFAADPNDFVSARDALARELSAAGDKDAAAAVKHLRRPPLPVWALNQTPRRDPDAVHALLDAARGAERAQEAVLGGGDAGQLRDALAHRRRTLATVVSIAREAIDESGRASESHVRELDDALNTVVSSPALREQLARGELTTLDAPGDDAVTMLGDVDLPEPPAAPAARAPSRQLVKARETVDARRAEADDAAAQAAAAAGAVASAEQALESARRAEGEARRRQTRADDALARSAEALARLERKRDH
jgi:hypothetical protein